MLHDITRELREMLSAKAEVLQATCGRAADKESALLWLLQNTGSSWAVCLTVSVLQPSGPPQDARLGRASLTIKLYIGMTPGMPKDADKRAEDMMLAWLYVWSLMARVRWGSAEETETPGLMHFTPRAGFLDDNRPMLPAGKAEFMRQRLQVMDHEGKKAEMKELLVSTQAGTTEIGLPVVSASEEDTGLIYLPPPA